MQDIDNPHDKIFRKALENKKEAAIIINRVLKEEDKVNSDEIELYNSKFISKKLRYSESDIVYKKKNENVFFLIEHQTKIDYSMPYRILKYELEIMDSVLINEKYIRKNYEFPVVISIVLYTGKQKWNAKKDIKSMQGEWKGYNIVDLSRYDVIDVNNISKRELFNECSIISKIMLLEKAKTEDELLKYIKEVCVKANHNYNSYEREFIENVIEVLVINKLGKEKEKNILRNIKIERSEESMLSSIDLLKQTTIDAMNMGIVKGRKEGRKEGRLEEKVEMIKNMLRQKASISFISKVSGLSEKEIKDLEDK